MAGVWQIANAISGFKCQRLAVTQHSHIRSPIPLGHVIWLRHLKKQWQKIFHHEEANILQVTTIIQDLFIRREQKIAH